MPGDKRRHQRLQGTRGLQHQIVGLIAQCGVAGDIQPELRARCQRQPVAGASEGDQARQIVIAVIAPPEHAQRQVHLGRRALEQRRGTRE